MRVCIQGFESECAHANVRVRVRVCACACVCACVCARVFMFKAQLIQFRKGWTEKFLDFSKEGVGGGGNGREF